MPVANYDENRAFEETPERALAKVIDSQAAELDELRVSRKTFIQQSQDKNDEIDRLGAENKTLRAAVTGLLWMVGTAVEQGATAVGAIENVIEGLGSEEKG
jgi:hypothetical protein